MPAPAVCATPGLEWLGAAVAYLLDRWGETGYEPLRDPGSTRRVAEVPEG